MTDQTQHQNFVAQLNAHDAKAGWPLDSHTTIEVGLRMNSHTGAAGEWGFHHSPTLKAVQEKTEWPASAAHPKGRILWAAPLGIEGEGEILLPDDAAAKYFAEKDCFLMTKVVVNMPDRGGYYAVAARYNDDPSKRMFGYDGMRPRRDDGSWVHSIPLHMQEPGKYQFFFVITMKLNRPGGDPNADRVDIKVHKLTVSRGKKHYRLMPELARPRCKEVLANDFAQGRIHRLPEYRDLPMMEAFRNFRKKCA